MPGTCDRAVRANTGSVGAVTAGPNRGLHPLLRRSRLDRRRWVVVLDTPLVPYGGRPSAAGGRRPRKAGTNSFHGYATAVRVEGDRRYTAGPEPYPPGDRPHDRVRRLLDRVGAGGLKITGVTADRGFDSRDTRLLRPVRKRAYAIPVRRKGGGANARNRRFGRPADRVHTGTWKTEVGRAWVAPAADVWRRSRRDRAVLVVGFAGWGRGRPGGPPGAPIGRGSGSRRVTGRRTRPEG